MSRNPYLNNLIGVQVPALGVGAEALAMARAAVPYFQGQWDAKQNWHTAARLADAQRALDIMEELQ